MTTIEEFQSCVELQRETWGWADVDLLPVRFLVTQHHVGGMLLGAFEGERLIGFVNALPGIREGTPYWHSHMLAVAKRYWNSGVGSRLKFAQREQARQRGIGLIEWTFDPLDGRTAHFNLEKLGVIVRRYYVNHYGRMAAPLQQDLDSDRVVAEWWIDRPRIVAGSGNNRRLSIPADFRSLKMKDLAAAKAVQLRIREEFLRNLREGYFAAGFERQDHSGVYVLDQEAFRVHQGH